MSVARLGAGVFLAFLATAANLANAAEQPVNVGLGAAAYGEMLLWLGVIVVFILVCAWLIKRLGGSFVATAGAIRVRSVVSMGSKERIALVEVGGKQILVGLCPSQINTLHVFDEDVFANQPDSESAGSSLNTDFGAKLQKLMSRDKNL